MLQGFKDFLLRRNVVDLAIAVVLGTAFGLAVLAFSTDVIGGLIGAVGGSPNFGNAGFTVNDSKIVIGSTINALINFAIVAAVIYFAIVVPMTRIAERRKQGLAPEVAVPDENTALLQEIRDLLRAQNEGR